MSEFPQKLATYFTESVVETLGYVDPSRPFLKVPEPDAAELAKLPLVAAIEFVGERAKGALTFCCSAEFLRLTTPVKTQPKGKEDVFQRDWLGETVNLILGSLKRKLSGHGLAFRVGTPYYAHYVATSPMALEKFGDGLYGDDGAVQEFWFECGRTRACFQLAIVTDMPIG